MTPEEKDKLFTAIGYSETTHNLTLPKQVISLGSLRGILFQFTVLF